MNCCGEAEEFDVDLLPAGISINVLMVSGAGALVCAQIGARLNRYLIGDYLKIMLAGVVLAVATHMAVSLTLTPPTMLTYQTKGH